MDNLLNEIEKYINKSVRNYIEKISEKYELNQRELMNLWNETENTALSPSRRTSVSTRNTCKHKFTRGAKKDQLCGKNCVEEYCGVHKKAHMNSTPIPTPLPKSESTNSINGESSRDQIVIKKNFKHGVFWHPATRLVFKSSDERIIVGKLSIDGENIKPLIREDIEECKKWKFAYQE